MLIKTTGKHSYYTGFNMVVRGLVEEIPVVRPYASDALVGFVSSVLGLSVEVDITVAVLKTA